MDGVEGRGRTYKGVRLLPGDEGFPGTVVTVAEQGPADDPGESSWVLWQPKYHSSAGIEWGYTGSGPADLALALLMDTLNEEYSIDEEYLKTSVAYALHQDFHSSTTAHLPNKGWELDQEEILRWVDERRVQANRTIDSLNPEFNTIIDSDL